MFQFSVAEIFIVVTTVAVAAVGIATRAESNRGVATLAAILIGFTMAGAPLLGWRRRTGALHQQWGLGELAWFYLGLYFLPLPLWSAISPVGRSVSQRWLTVGFVMSSAICAAAIVLVVGKLLLRGLGGYQSSGREWFSLRTTNLVGLIILALYTFGGIGVLAWLDLLRP